jgi:hypothetical protein
MWIYKNKEFAPDESLLDPKVYYGFVYEITDLQNQKKYIGKKFFWATKTLPVTKSRKRKKRLLVESNWKDYYGSSETLSEEVTVKGKESFRREILKLCKTKSECTYYEAKYQFERDVLLKDEYYNDWISAKVRRSHLKHLIEHKEK